MLLLFADAVVKKQLAPFSHVRDSRYIEIFESIGWEIDLSPFTKFQVFIVLSAVIVAAAMIWLAAKMKTGEPPKGRLWNLMEGLLYFIRNKIVIPAIGEQDAHKYSPFLASLFLFIFLMNLFGIIPFMPSPTTHIYVTSVLALVSFFVIHISGVHDHGTVGYLKTFIPHVELEGGARYLGYLLIPMMAGVEYLTAFIRAIVLSVRLFANMLAGHTVLFILLFFIKMVADPVFMIPFAEGKDWLYWPVSIFSVLLVFALTLLEIFIAGLQAFIFTFLAAIYIGLAKHPPH
jgi:F-type H+-transporting ATPase subunit a